jgi:hypothetical protein
MDQINFVQSKGGQGTSVFACEPAEQGWSREIERHTATARRIASLLDELHEPLICPDDSRSTGDGKLGLRWGQDSRRRPDVMVPIGPIPATFGEQPGTEHDRAKTEPIADYRTEALLACWRPPPPGAGRTARRS